jgi:hypothetical protein
MTSSGNKNIYKRKIQESLQKALRLPLPKKPSDIGMVSKI